MRTLAVNSENDLYLDNNGNLAVAIDLQAVLQNCEHAVKVRLGEVVLDITEGVPYFETIFSGSQEVAQFDAALRQAVLDVEGVLEVIDLTTVQEDHQFNYTMTIRTIYGIGVANGNL